MTTVAEAVRAAQARLAHLEEGRLMAEVLLAQALNWTRTHVLARPQALLTPAAQAVFDSWVARAASGEPLPYIIEQREFYGLDFYVNPSVLIPRPETEQLVDWALAHVPAEPLWLADVGTGSGCIAVTLARHRPQASVLAVDVSAAALKVAQRNAQTHGVAHRVLWVQAHLLGAVTVPVRALVANLPYIPSALAHTLPVAAHEPMLALDGGPHGLTLIDDLLAHAPRLLTRPGDVFLEIHPGQGALLAERARALFPAATLTVRPDWAGHERLVHLHVP